MKSVDLYHLVAMVALVLILVCGIFWEVDAAFIFIGVSLTVILLLGVHLALDRQDRKIEKIERTITEVKTELAHIRIALDFDFSIKPAEQAAIIDSLGSINRMINEMKQEDHDASFEKIKGAVEELKSKIEEISVK